MLRERKKAEGPWSFGFSFDKLVKHKILGLIMSHDTGREVDLTATATLSRRHMDGRINDLRQSPTATAWALCKMPFGDVYRILQG